MDIIFRDKVIEGGSSDEEEVFESVDEGEEFLKIVKLIFVMLVDIRFVNFMLKELVGKNDVLLISQVVLGQEMNIEIVVEWK